MQIDQSLISLGPLETITIYFMVCLVSGLVLASPWVFYQGWAFVAAGLYRHEQNYVMRYLPMSLRAVSGRGDPLLLVRAADHAWLPARIQRLAGRGPTLRLSEWMSFATILPLVFGLAFQTPLIMLFLERIGIFTVDDFRAKRKISILIITDRRRRAHSRPRPVQHDPAGHSHDLAVRAGHPADRRR